VAIVAGDPGYGHVALALALGGRAALASGAVTVDGVDDARRRRRHVALVDVPDVTAPDDAVPVGAVVAEELALSGLPSGRRAVRSFLQQRHSLERAGDRFEHLPPHERTAWLMATAASRPDARVLVVAHPDRLGGDPHHWWAQAEAFAADGMTVVVQCTHATARQLGHHDCPELGA
jgi:hypothetical protein